MARLVVPGVPHHVTQRGNRRQQTFFSDDDYTSYRTLLAEHCDAANVAVWAYCLMPNHVHLILVPEDPDGLRRALGETHRRYTRRVNEREGWQGHFWQERFHSFPMDEPYVLMAARYIETNPVRAKLVSDAADWPWSSAAAHIAGQDDGLVTVAPLLDMASGWPAVLKEALPTDRLEPLRQHSRTGRPLGAQPFIESLEKTLGRALAPRRRGRKSKREVVE